MNLISREELKEKLDRGDMFKLVNALGWCSSNNDNNNLAAMSQSEWETPVFVKIKEKKTKRLSPYSETELLLVRIL